MENLQSVNITTTFEFDLGGLTLVNIPLGYNRTRITCSANVTSSSGSQVKAMQHSVLLLQGTSNVTSLQLLEWTTGLWTSFHMATVY